MAGDVYRLPRRHAADDRVRLIAALAQECRRLLAGVAVAADDRDGSSRVEVERSDVGEGEEFGVRMRVKVEFGPEHDVAAIDFLWSADIENLQWLPAVESLRELLWRDLWQRRRGGIRHGR